MPKSLLKLHSAVAAVVLLLAGDALAQTAKLDKGDANLLQDIARANIAEIQTGNLASKKAKDPAVKKFARTMVTDHTKGLSDVSNVAAAKGVNLTRSPDAAHKAAALEFKALRGDAFDSRYVKQAGVGDHESTEQLLQKTQANAKEADVKALADKMMPVVQAHLAHARELAAARK
jgi:putative membrane protein